MEFFYNENLKKNYNDTTVRSRGRVTKKIYQCANIFVVFWAPRDHTAKIPIPRYNLIFELQTIKTIKYLCKGVVGRQVERVRTCSNIVVGG